MNYLERSFCWRIRINTRRRRHVQVLVIYQVSFHLSWSYHSGRVFCTLARVSLFLYTSSPTYIYVCTSSTVLLEASSLEDEEMPERADTWRLAVLAEIVICLYLEGISGRVKFCTCLVDVSVCEEILWFSVWFVWIKFSSKTEVLMYQVLVSFKLNFFQKTEILMY